MYIVLLNSVENQLAHAHLHVIIANFLMCSRFSSISGSMLTMVFFKRSSSMQEDGRMNMEDSRRPGWVRNQLQNIFQPTDNKLAMKLFGSKKALIQERVRQKAAGHWIIHPCSSFR